MAFYSSLTLKRLELAVTLGWPDAERRQKQLIYLDIHLRFLEKPKACESDQLADTICYNHLTEQLFTQLADKKFHLLEHLIQSLYEMIRSHLPQTVQLALRVTKYPDIPGLKEGVAFHYGEMELAWSSLV